MLRQSSGGARTHTRARSDTASLSRFPKPRRPSQLHPPPSPTTWRHVSHVPVIEDVEPVPIAIIGLACRLPGRVTTAEELWELCSRSRSGWSEIPKTRFNHEAYYHPDPEKRGCYNAVGAHFIDEDPSLFDAPFFNINEQEATSMDPQQRLLLECTYEALENAGLPLRQLAGQSVGVFTGASFADYDGNNTRDLDSSPNYQATGSAAALLSNRMSYYFDFRGPSFTVDTACSSSLTALHLAVQSLQKGDSSVAVVGGAHLNMTPDLFVTMSTAGLFSDEGRCFSFDNRGSGYGRGEGIGCVILKPLDKAIEANDPIRALIKATGIGQDGRTKGITMPNGAAQSSLIQQVYKNAGLDPSQTGYIEAHGTGTAVGDPIEASALHEVFSMQREENDPLFVGSVKSNVGHLEGASGVISVIKTAMMLQKGWILPNYDFHTANKKIPLKAWNLEVPTRQRPWPGGKSLASINNFGFGGGNAHTILQKYQRPPRSQHRLPPLPRRLMVFSGYDLQAVKRRAADLTVFLELRPEVFEHSLMQNLAYTLGQRREHFNYRAATTAADANEFIANLLLSDFAPFRSTKPPRVAFIFTGQGAQWYAMGRELIQHYPVFRAAIDAADECLMQFGATFSLQSELRRDKANSILSHAHVSQPACTAIQLALVDLLRDWGVEPSAVIGHSSGEIAAAYAAGCLGFEDCMAIAYHRGKAIPLLKHRHPDLVGTMMAVGAGRNDAEELVKSVTTGKAVVACINSPQSVTISGDDAAVSEIGALCEARGMFNRKLQVDVAYHSHHMSLVAQDYLNSIKNIKGVQGQAVEFYSSLRGGRVDGSALDASYWVDNLVSPVQFSEGMRELYKANQPQMIVELGPHAVLQGPVKQILTQVSANDAKTPYVSALVRGQDALKTAQKMAADLFAHGANLSLEAINFPQGIEAKVLTDLPRYPWNHEKSYWHQSRIGQTHRHKAGARNDISGTLAVYSNDIQPTWRNFIRLDEMPWLRQHKMQTLVVYPLAGYLSMAIEAMNQRSQQRGLSFDGFELREVTVSRPLVLREGKDIETNVTLRSHTQGTRATSDKWDEFSVFSWETSTGWIEHCHGLISVTSSTKSDPVSSLTPSKEINGISNRITAFDKLSPKDLKAEQVYTELTGLGADYGPVFRGLEDCRVAGLHAVARTSVLESAPTMPKSHEPQVIMHPAILDQIVQLGFPILGAGQQMMQTLYMPSFVQKLSISTSIREKTRDNLQLYAIMSPGYAKPSPRKIDIWAGPSDDQDNVMIHVEGLTVTPVASDNTDADSLTARELCFQIEWQEFQPSCNAPKIEELSLEDPEATAAVPPAPVIQPSPVQLPEVSILCTSNQQSLLAAQLKTSLQERFEVTAEIEQLDTCTPKSKVYIVVVEVEESLLLHMTAQVFEKIQSLVSAASSIIWASAGAQLERGSPTSSLVTGLARTVRSETTMPFITVDLEMANADPKLVVEKLSDLFHAIVITKETSDAEFRYREGQFWAPRANPDLNMDSYVHKQISAAARELQPFHQDGRALKFEIGSGGALDTLYFDDDDVFPTPLGDMDVEVQIKATGMNFKDVMIAMGQLSSPYLGIECAGVVSRIGAGVTDHTVGDRVMAMGYGAYSTYTRCLSSSAHRIPEGMSFEQAATIPVVFCTAYYALFDLARLQKGERVLIHAAAGGVGQAAVALCQTIGVEIFATVGNQTKKQHLIDTFGLQEDHILYSRDTTFAADIRRLTNNQGVDVVLNSLAGEFLRETWDCLAKFGRFIEIGKRDIVSNSYLEMAKFEMNVMFASVDLTLVAAERPQLMKRILDDVFDLFTRTLIKPITPVTVFPISDVESAFRTLQGGKTLGKIVVTAGPEDQVKTVPRKLVSGLLEQNATYIIIGGTGGVGRSMTRWMVQQGAKHIVLLSRTGKMTPALTELIDHGHSSGANIHVKACDVSDAAQVTNLLKSGLADMPPVKGLIHSAMVLHDALFEKMVFEQWEEVVKSKVAGCHNFHVALADTKMDFFIVLSSVAGIVGNRGQAAYAAANCYLDALMEQRRSQGLPGTSLALCAVSDIGFLAENADRAQVVNKNLGGEGISEKEILALLTAAVDTKPAQPTTGSGFNCITGMDTRSLSSEPYWMADGKFVNLKRVTEGAETGSAVSLQVSLRMTTDVEEAQALVCDALIKKIAAVLMIPDTDISSSDAPANHGLDSLAAIEIRNWITRELEAGLAVLELLTSESFMALSGTILEKSRIWTVGK